MMQRKTALKFLIAIGAWSANHAAMADGAEEPVPSFYQEPGISRTRDYVNQHANEKIDPFTGKLQWHYVDLFIPGNGGFDFIPATPDRGAYAAPFFVYDRSGGAFNGRLYLAAYALGMGASGLTFLDDAVTDFFSPHARGKSVMFLIALGRKRKRS